jgi:para-nitrobenzyl esterase
MKLFTMVDGGGDPALAGRRARRLVGERLDSLLAAYRRALPDAADDELWTALGTDAVFRIPAIRLLERQSAQGTPCWSYLFSVRSTAFGGALGSCHALDIPFVFDILDRPGVDLFVGTPPGGPAVAHAMHASWGSFARSGSPASPGLAEWAAYDTDRRVTMEFGERIGPVDDPLAGQREAWAS